MFLFYVKNIIVVWDDVDSPQSSPFDLIHRQIFLNNYSVKHMTENVSTYICRLIVYTPIKFTRDDISVKVMSRAIIADLFFSGSMCWGERPYEDFEDETFIIFGRFELIHKMWHLKYFPGHANTEVMEGDTLGKSLTYFKMTSMC